MLVPLATSGQPVPIAKFHHAIHLYHDRPHLVNKRLCSVSTLFHYKVLFHGSNGLNLTDVLNYTSLVYETSKVYNQYEASRFTKDTLASLLSSLLLPYDRHVEIIELTSQVSRRACQGVIITVRVLLPSNPRCKDTVEVVLFNYDENYVQFLSASACDKYLLVAPPFAYTFQMQSDVLQLIVDIEDANTASGEWLADKLFPKILKWCEGINGDDHGVVQSLSLVNVVKYCETYKRLKEKYGRKMIEIWPENTDPLKFVYEDVAIATYLICLWSGTPSGHQENDTKPFFVDLGCGNGLLVYILGEEGYPGLGIDVRPRKIWQWYPKTTNLQVKTIVPSDSNLYPEADWIIGNHSDELTPWIPVIAARSSATTNFFLLPCCAYNFDGTRYKRINTSISQYSEYLQYVENVSNACGFTTSVDKLRIPSTKRTCLVGRSPRTLSNDEIATNIATLLDDVRSTSSSNVSNSNDNSWISNYRARESREKVRNCTKLDCSFVNGVVRKLAHALLTVNPQGNDLLKKNAGKAETVECCGSDEVWNAGACVDIVSLVRVLEPHELSQLKCECGGLQTLMKNHRYIFDVEKGRVKLRPPYLRSDTSKYIDKPCWFLRHHPQGCLHSAVNCAYSHD